MVFDTVLSMACQENSLQNPAWFNKITGLKSKYHILNNPWLDNPKFERNIFYTPLYALFSGVTRSHDTRV